MGLSLLKFGPKQAYVFIDDANSFYHMLCSPTEEMLLKVVILAKAVDAVTGWGWMETWFLNSGIMKISEPSLPTGHTFLSFIRRAQLWTCRAETVPPSEMRKAQTPPGWCENEPTMPVNIPLRALSTNTWTFFAGCISCSDESL